METRALGRSGVRCGRIGLGCATFGREIDEAQAFRIMDYAVEKGITLFDTAEAYGGGQARMYRKKQFGVEDEREVSGEMHSSEKIIGRWLARTGARGQVVLLTKVTTNFRPEHVREALAASLDRLQTNVIDIYLYHQFDSGSPLAEAADAADEGVRRGLVRAAGCSNYSGAQLEAALRESESRGLHRFEVIQSNYNLAVRDIEADLLPLTKRESVGVVSYSPLGAGFLSGKYATPDRGAFPKGTRFDVIPGHADVYFSERNFRLVDQLHACAGRVGIPALRLAMAWVFRNPAIDVVLAGARTTQHLDNAVEAMQTEIDSGWMTEMNSW